MTRPRRGPDLEVVPVDDDSAAWPGPRVPRPHPGPGGRRRRRPPTPVAWTVGVAGAAAIVIAALVVRAVGTHGTGSPSLPRPTAVDINSRPSVTGSQVVTVVGDKIIARDIVAANGGAGLLGVIRLEPPAPTGSTPPAAVLAVNGAMVVAQGSDMADASGTGRSGTWSYTTDASRRQKFLGPSTGFRSFLDTGRVWLTTATTAWGVDLVDGQAVDGPYPLADRLVAVVGRGLVLQRDDRVVCSRPGAPPDSVAVGRGTALGGFGEYILWEAADGRLTITDPNTGRAWRTAVVAATGRLLGAAALSPDRFRVAVVDGATLRIGDGVLGSHSLALHLGQVGEVAWLDDDTLVATVGARGLVAIDGATGHVAHEPDFIFDSRGLAVLAPGNR